ERKRSKETAKETAKETFPSIFSSANATEKIDGAGAPLFAKKVEKETEGAKGRRDDFKGKEVEMRSPGQLATMSKVNALAYLNSLPSTQARNQLIEAYLAFCQAIGSECKEKRSAYYRAFETWQNADTPPSKTEASLTAGERTESTEAITQAQEQA